MNTPALLLVATLIFWGLQTGLIWVAVLSALILEGSRLVDQRRFFTPLEFRRIVFLCDLLLIGVCFYSLSISLAGDYPAGGFTLIQLLPLALLPLMAVQAYGTDERIDIRKLSLYVSKKRTAATAKPPVDLNITHVFWGVVLLAASVAQARIPWFYGWLFLLVAWGLWGRRPAHSPVILWLLLLLCVGGAGLLGHIQLHHLQDKVEDGIARLLSGSGDNNNADPSRSVTAMGRIGNLKLSSRILLRVKANHALSAPLLLREASYTTYRNAAWLAGKSMFQTLRPGPGGDSWQIAPSGPESGSLLISASLEEGNALLPLPSGTTRITGLPAGELKRSQLGTVMVANGPDRPSYEVRYDPGNRKQGPPTELDLQVPATTASFLAPIAAELGVAHQAPEKNVENISEYFRRNFRYTTVQKELKPGEIPLENFLLRSHAGHCEFFATATVLLLRTAGIPARYVTGYSVQEFSQWEKLYLVRSRHAHAWAEAYINGTWRTLDTTPQSWYGQEEPKGFHLQVFADLWSWFVYRFSNLNLAEFREKAGNRLLWLLLPLILFPGYRLLRSQWQPERRPGIKQARKAPLPGTDSEWYLLEQRLRQVGLARNSLERYGEWLKRISHDPLVAGKMDQLARIVSLHCRYRFDPNGVTAAERLELRNTVAKLLQTIIPPHAQ